jgi:hypothetical protein
MLAARDFGTQRPCTVTRVHGRYGLQMGKGYAEGPAVEEAEAERERGPHGGVRPSRRAVYGSTDDDPTPHFLGWLGEVDPDALFESGAAWGISLVERPA